MAIRLPQRSRRVRRQPTVAIPNRVSLIGHPGTRSEKELIKTGYVPATAWSWRRLLSSPPGHIPAAAPLQNKAPIPRPRNWQGAFVVPLPLALNHLVVGRSCNPSMDSRTFSLGVSHNIDGGQCVRQPSNHHGWWLSGLTHRHRKNVRPRWISALLRNACAAGPCPKGQVRRLGPLRPIAIPIRFWSGGDPRSRRRTCRVSCLEPVPWLRQLK